MPETMWYYHTARALVLLRRYYSKIIGSPYVTVPFGT
jgi:hypothetical protein